MIIAIKDGDCIHLSFDIIEWGLVGVMHDDLMLESNRPYWVLDTKAPTLMTLTQNLTARDLFRYAFPFAEIKDIKQVQLEIVPWIRKTLIENQIIQDKEKETFESFLIAREDRLFVVDQYFFAEEIHDYSVIGYPSRLAMYMLEKTSHSNPIERMRNVYKTVIDYRHRCTRSFYVINTKDMILKSHNV
jgi:hypothetical protein